MASIEKLDGVVGQDGRQAYRVRWRVWQPDGSRRSRETRVYGHDEAKALRADMEEQHEGPREVVAQRLDVATEAWLRHYATVPRRVRGHGGRRRKLVEPTSVEEAYRAAMWMIHHWGPDRLLSSITVEDFTECVEARTKREYRGTDQTGERVYEFGDEPASDGTKQRLAATMASFFGDARKLGWVADNIAEDVDFVWVSATRKVEPSLVVVRTMADEMDVPTYTRKLKGGGTEEQPRWQGVYDPELWRPSDRLWLIVLTATAWSEASGIRAEDDHGDHLKLVRVMPRADDEPREYGKSGSRIPRDVPVPSQLRPVLDRLKAYSKDGYLMTGPDGSRLQYETMRNQIAGATKRIRKRDPKFTGYTVHGLRHLGTSLWIRAGANPLLVMKAGGWASLDMVSKVYGHLWPSDVVELGRKVDALDWDAIP